MPEQASPAPANETFELRIERLLPTSPQQAFDAWTDPRTLMRWWGPEGFHTPEAALDISPGGAWRTRMVSPAGDSLIVSGAYREIVRPTRLVFTWGWEDEHGTRDMDSVVELTFSPAGQGTRMLLIHRKLPTAIDRDRHQTGWTSSLTKLVGLFA